MRSKCGDRRRPITALPAANWSVDGDVRGLFVNIFWTNRRRNLGAVSVRQPVVVQEAQLARVQSGSRAFRGASGT